MENNVQHRVGIGYDVHRLVEGRKLVIGGVEIPYSKGLLGHSDADVLLHAISDALLGAIGKGDIGEHFPDNDEKYKDISSMQLLKRVSDLVTDEGYVISNVDTVIQAQEPKLMQYKSQMKFHIAYELAIDEDSVNIKATTLEKLGPIGNCEGIAAFATVLLAKKA